MTAIDRIDPQGHPVPLPESARTSYQITAVPEKPKPLPPMVAGFRLVTVATALIAWTITAWTFGLMQGGDVLNPSHNGLDFHDKIQIAVRNYGWLSAFQGLGWMWLQVGLIVGFYLVIRRHARQEAAR